jgi:hypothetical protein
MIMVRIRSRSPTCPFKSRLRVSLRTRMARQTSGHEIKEPPRSLNAAKRFDWKLTDSHIADLVRYIRNGRSNAAPAVIAETMAEARDATGVPGPVTTSLCGKWNKAPGRLLRSQR